MVRGEDLHGVMAMMPAFATPDAADFRANSTVAVDNLQQGVDRIIKDGVNVIATTGSFGEFHTLLWEEFETITRATVEAVNKRVPLFIGCTSLNSRETFRRMAVARDAGADGVLIGVPFYFPSTVDNAVRFYHDMAESYRDLAIMIYHNPPLHRITIPVDAFNRLVLEPNIVAMKDSHRTPDEFQDLKKIIRDQIHVFVNTSQYVRFAPLGAAGCWSFDLWMAPWPMLRLRDAVEKGDQAAAESIQRDLYPGGVPTPVHGAPPPDLTWRETLSKIAIGFAGYCDPGPLRPPFVEIPDDVMERAKARAAQWQALGRKYGPVGAATGA
jgi:hydratase-aldolase